VLSFQNIMPKLKDIISKEFGNKKIFDKDVAQALGINQLTFATMKKRNKVPYKEILDFCATRKISINWMFYDQIVKSLEEETDKYANVRYYSDIYASAGGGAFNYEDEHEELLLDAIMIEKLGGAREIKNIDAINVLGDSMEPTYNENDIVFINRSMRDITKGGVFVVSTNSGLFIKRILLKSDRSIDLISDNKLYGVENVPLDSVEIIGKVVGSMGST